MIVISPLPTNHSKWSSAAKEKVEMGALKEGRAQQRREKVGVMGGAKRNIYSKKPADKNYRGVQNRVHGGK